MHDISFDTSGRPAKFEPIFEHEAPKKLLDRTLDLPFDRAPAFIGGKAPYLGIVLLRIEVDPPAAVKPIYGRSRSRNRHANIIATHDPTTASSDQYLAGGRIGQFGHQFRRIEAQMVPAEPILIVEKRACLVVV
ncbi:hypothetical protein OF829_13605 [Sphingomonas sp. LB-2]|nr:hypothetical protein [Sphingomonas caeni]